MKREIVSSGINPQGPYSPAVMVGDWVFISGQLGITEGTTDIKEQTRRALEKVALLLKEAGLTMDNVVKVTLFIKEGEDFSLVNEVYSEFFHKVYPARSTVFVSSLPKNALIEIGAVARR